MAAGSSRRRGATSSAGRIRRRLKRTLDAKDGQATAAVPPETASADGTGVRPTQAAAAQEAAPEANLATREAEPEAAVEAAEHQNEGTAIEPSTPSVVVAPQPMVVVGGGGGGAPARAEPTMRPAPAETGPEPSAAVEQPPRPESATTAAYQPFWSSPPPPDADAETGASDKAPAVATRPEPSAAQCAESPAPTPSTAPQRSSMRPPPTPQSLESARQSVPAPPLPTAPPPPRRADKAGSKAGKLRERLRKSARPPRSTSVAPSPFHANAPPAPEVPDVAPATVHAATATPTPVPSAAPAPEPAPAQAAPVVTGPPQPVASAPPPIPAAARPAPRTVPPPVPNTPPPPPPVPTAAQLTPAAVAPTPPPPPPTASAHHDAELSLPGGSPSGQYPSSQAPIDGTAPHAAVVTESSFPADSGRPLIEVNLGPTTLSNIFMGFSGELGRGGVYVPTYEPLPVGCPVELLITMSGGFETRALGRVRFRREQSADEEMGPGLGVGFETLTIEGAQLLARFARLREPEFYAE